MPAYNAEQFIGASVRSVLSQWHKELELIVIDDCSTDNTAAILQTITDPRLKVIRNPRNRGVASSLNEGLKLTRGEYVARMDADDICLPWRLSLQTWFMRTHRDVDVLGSSILVFGRALPRVLVPDTTDAAIKAELVFRSPMFHPTVMFRANSTRVNYDIDQPAAEDLALWARLARGGTRFANTFVPTVLYRIYGGSVSDSSRAKQRESSRRIREDFAAAQIGVAGVTLVEALEPPLHRRGIESATDVDLIFEAAHNAVVRNGIQCELDPGTFRRKVHLEAAKAVMSSQPGSVALERGVQMRKMLTTSWSSILHAWLYTQVRRLPVVRARR